MRATRHSISTSGNNDERRSISTSDSNMTAPFSEQPELNQLLIVDLHYRHCCDRRHKGLCLGSRGNRVGASSLTSVTAVTTGCTPSKHNRFRFRGSLYHLNLEFPWQKGVFPSSSSAARPADSVWSFVPPRCLRSLPLSIPRATIHPTSCFRINAAGATCAECTVPISPFTQPRLRLAEVTNES